MLNLKTFFATVLVFTVYLLFSISYVLADDDSNYYIQHSIGLDRVVEAMAGEVARSIEAMVTLPESLIHSVAFPFAGSP